MTYITEGPDVRGILNSTEGKATPPPSPQEAQKYVYYYSSCSCSVSEKKLVLAQRNTMSTAHVNSVLFKLRLYCDMFPYKMFFYC
jgi:hypothetical protein